MFYEKDSIIVAFDETAGEIVSTAKLIPVSDIHVEVSLEDADVKFLEDVLCISMAGATKISGTTEDINVVLRKLFAIEAEEAREAGDDPISDRGAHAARLVTLIAK